MSAPASLVSWRQADPQRGDVPVAMISLPDQEHRRDLCLERGFPNDWVTDYWPATDLRGAERAAASELADIPAMEAAQGRAVTAAEVGCAASHRAVAEWLLRSGHDLVLVFEDDAVPLATDFQQTVRETAGLLAIHAAKGAAFVCHLGARPEQLRDALARPVRFGLGGSPAARAALRLHCDPGRSLWRAHAYILSRAAAERQVRRETAISTVADDWCLKRRLGFFDELLFSEPRIFAQDEVVESTIGPRESTPNLSATASVVFRVGAILRSDEPLERLLTAAMHRLRRADAVVRSRFPYFIA